jgi:uncharacterized protein
MSRSATLLQLQTLDLDLDAHRARVQAIDHELGSDPAVQTAQRALLQAHNELHSARVAVQGLEYENQTIGEKIAEINDRIYSGSVTNPKVLQELQKENESFQRRRTALEEKQFEALMAAEAAETQQAQWQQQLDQAETAAASAHSALHQERERHLLVMANLEGDREGVLAQVPPADLEVYERLRAAKKGRAVAIMDENACGACGVELSSALSQTVRQTTELVLCRNCGRILCAN